MMDNMNDLRELYGVTELIRNAPPQLQAYIQSIESKLERAREDAAHYREVSHVLKAEFDQLAAKLK